MTTQPWLRWWKVPGEVLWENGIDGVRWRAEFVSDDGSLWDIRIVRDEGASPDLGVHWDPDEGALVVVDAAAEGLTPNARWWLNDAVTRRSKGAGRPRINAPSRRVLTLIADSLGTDEWVSGRRLRRELSIERPAFQSLVGPLLPRLVRNTEGDGGDSYSLTLPGLLLEGVGERFRPVVELVLETIADLFAQDPDVKDFTWHDLRERGAAESEYALYRSTISIASLHQGCSGSSGLKESGPHRCTWAVPTDIEALARVRSLSEFERYVTGGGHQQPRPWPTAPLWLEDVDGRMPQIQMSTSTTSAPPAGVLFESGRASSGGSAMVEISKTDQEAVLRDAGWIPVGQADPAGGVKPLGEGGGARAFKVVSARAANRLVMPLLTSRSQAEANAPLVAEAIGDFLDRVEFPVAVAKFAKRDEPRTLREIKVLKTVSNRHLIEILEHEDADNPRWYITPIYRSGSLAERAATFVGDFRGVFRQALLVSDAIVDLHSANFVHRDVKPSNIFLRRNGDWVLADPGIAYELDATVHTEGTRPFSRDWFPRWYEDQLGHTPRVDLYMLTATMICLLAGEKALAPSWLSKDTFNFSLRFQHVEGVEEAQRFLAEHFVDDPETMRSRSAGEYRSGLAEVLAGLEARPHTIPVFSWVASESTSGLNVGQNALNDIAVFLPSRTRRLRAKVRIASSARGPTCTIGYWFGDSEPTPVSEPYRPNAGKGWSDELIAAFERGLEPGWHRISLDLKGQGEVDGLVVYADLVS